jgi:hypothetical protein
MRCAILLSLAVALLPTTSNPADDKAAKEAAKPSNQAGDLGDYLTKDGNLKEAITFGRYTVGLAPAGSPKGEVWTIEPTGDWTSKVAGAKGKLSAKQLAALAQHLATQDFNSLPQTQGYRQQVLDEVYQRVIIGFGKKTATFNIKPEESRIDYLPNAGDQQAAAAWSRFVALELVLTDVLHTTAESKDKKEK